MLLFLLSYFIVYGGMQAVFFLRVQALLPQGILSRLLLGLFLLLMLLCPIISRLLEEAGLIFLAGLTAWSGYSWMGFVFLAFWLSLIMYCLQGVLGFFGNWTAREIPLLPSDKVALLVIFLSAALCIYGFTQSSDLQTERQTVLTSKISPDRQAIRVVQISDLHLGLVSRPKMVQKVVTRVQKLQPDILVCTGDMLDGSSNKVKTMLELWGKVEVPGGKYAVSGNHETYVGLERSREMLNRAGFKFLDDQVRVSSQGVQLVGIPFQRDKGCNPELKLLQNIQSGLFTILLKHSPQICEQGLGDFDLQLSGHTHKGQIFPFHLLVKLFYPYISGMYDLNNGSKIYVSRGTGTWGPQMRILADPEISLFEIRGLTGD